VEGPLSRELELPPPLLGDEPLSCELDPELLPPPPLDDEPLLSCELELELLLELLLEGELLSCELLGEGALSCELEPPLGSLAAPGCAATAARPGASSRTSSAEDVKRTAVFFMPTSVKQRSWSLRFGFNSNWAFMSDLLFRLIVRLPGKPSRSTWPFSRGGLGATGAASEQNLPDRPVACKSMDMRFPAWNPDTACRFSRAATLGAQA
jgi:hypothetical protein